MPKAKPFSNLKGEVERTIRNGQVVSDVIRRVSAQTPGQADYIRAINDNRLVFCHGPAGTGKSHCAAGSAAWALQKNDVERIVCVRPAVGAGDPIGFLPGTADEKLMPYLRPILMELNRYFLPEEMKAYRSGDFPTIEIQPLEFMRGLTFRDCFIIVDEAQNATFEQMRMIITRLGEGSKMIINGDVTQSDLREDRRGGFDYYSKKWPHVDEVATVYLTRNDIVRDPLLRILMETMD